MFLKNQDSFVIPYRAVRCPCHQFIQGVTEQALRKAWGTAPMKTNSWSSLDSFGPEGRHGPLSGGLQGEPAKAKQNTVGAGHAMGETFRHCCLRGRGTVSAPLPSLCLLVSRSLSGGFILTRAFSTGP